MKKLIFLLFFSFILAQPNNFDIHEFKLEVLPPAKLENNGILFELSVSANKNNFVFNLLIDNQSMQQYKLNKGTEITFNGEYPEKERYKSEVIIVLPNEKMSFEIIFKKQELVNNNQSYLQIKDLKFLVSYKKVNANLKKLADISLTKIYYEKNQIIITGNGQAVIFINNTKQPIFQLMISAADDYYEFKPLDYKYWLIDKPVSVNMDSFFLIREKPEEELKIVNFSSERQKTKRSLINPKHNEQYSLSLIPQKAKKGSDFSIRVFSKYQPKIERITVQVFDKSIVLKQSTSSVWEKLISVPAYIYLGKYPVKVYIKDDQGIVVLTGQIEVM